MAKAETHIKHFPLNEGGHLFSASLGNLLIGCPPEVLKLLLQKHLPLPDTVVIPSRAIQRYSSLACLEFPFYHFLFIQQGLAQGRKFRVLATREVVDKLSDMMRVTLLGPEVAEVLEAEKKLALRQGMDRAHLEQIHQECRFLALKNKQGQVLEIKELIEFIPFEVGDEIKLYEKLNGDPAVFIHRQEKDQFTVSAGGEVTCKLELTEPLRPVYEIKGVRVSTTERASSRAFSARILGNSEGFDPMQPANGVLLHFKGKWVMWDSPAFFRSHLAYLGLDFQELDALFISHVHEDHLDAAQTLEEGYQTPLYTSPDIFHSMLLKVMALKNCSYLEAAKHYEYHPVLPNQPFDLFGAKAEVFNSLHAIPALGFRLSVPTKAGEKRLYISGDHLPKRMINTLKEAKVLGEARIREVQAYDPAREKYDLVLVDSGSGMIHGDPQDQFDNPNPVNYMHRGKQLKDLPPHHKQVKAGHRFQLHS